MRVKLFAILSLILFFTPFFSYAEYIQNFDAAIDINPDSSFNVTETIDYVFTSPRHGIYRYIPKTLPPDQKSSVWYKTRYLNINVTGVRMDGVPTPYEVTDQADKVFVKIGDPNYTVSGEHTYEIRYTVTGGLSYSKEYGTEIYWNATGFDWAVIMHKVSVTLTAPEGAFTNSRACYQGEVGKAGSCSKSIENNGQILFSTTELGPREGMTVAQGLNSSEVAKVILERTNTFWFWGMAVLIWFLGLGYFVLRYKTAYKIHESIIPQYEPYEDFKPMYTGLLFDGKLDPKDITAGIIYLAQQGFLKIRKVEKKVLFFIEVDDYEIELTKPMAEVESSFQKRVLELLFGSATTTGSKVSLSDLKDNVTKQRENQTILRDLRKDLEQDLEDSGFFQINIPRSYIVGAVVGLMVVAWFLFSLISIVLTTNVVLLGAWLIVSLVILSFMYRRRTRKGYEALDYLEGFRQFLSVTEKERYEFHNAPAKSPEQFMEYLPYAIAFGVEEEWAKTFKDVTIPSPDWYEGGAAGSFSAANLTTSIGAFSTAFTASSSSSGGSGGGGFAGGGGGGGGGGSW